MCYTREQEREISAIHVSKRKRERERERILQILTLWQDTEPIKRSAGIPHILERGKYKKI